VEEGKTIVALGDTVAVPDSAAHQEQPDRTTRKPRRNKSVEARACDSISQYYGPTRRSVKADPFGI
jgi:hypothetical protein